MRARQDDESIDIDIIDILLVISGNECYATIMRQAARRRRYNELAPYYYIIRTCYYGCCRHGITYYAGDDHAIRDNTMARSRVVEMVNMMTRGVVAYVYRRRLVMHWFGAGYAAIVGIDGQVTTFAGYGAIDCFNKCWQVTIRRYYGTINITRRALVDYATHYNIDDRNILLMSSIVTLLRHMLPATIWHYV